MRVLVVFTRRLSEIEYFRSQPFGPRLVAQIILWALGLGIWFIAPFLVFPLAKAVIVLAVVHICMGLYLSNVFAPNHKGMPQVPKGTSISFLEQQIITSRNVKPSWITDVIYMGLNYQIEHHLFPSCPRNKLKQITPYVLEVCRETGIEYTQTGIIESNRIVLGELNRIARMATG